MPFPDMTAPVPIIDISESSNPEAVDELAAKIDRACRDVGFFAVTGHGISSDLRAAVLDAAKRFFSLAVEAKEQVAIARSANNRGYVAIAGERLQPDLPPDNKETFELGLERPASDPENSPLEGPNQWPDVDGFRITLETYQGEALRTSQVLLRLIARALDLPDHFFDERMSRSLTNTRLIHYPAGPDTAEASIGEPEALGCGAHSDYGCLTLLFEDGAPGLQLQQLDGSWRNVEVPPDSLIVNLGDLLQRWTNDRYRSTRHRVTRPVGRDRYSVPVFVNTDWHTEVATFASCISKDHPARYEPVLAGEYLQSRFDDTYLYRGDS